MKTGSCRWTMPEPRLKPGDKTSTTIDHTARRVVLAVGNLAPENSFSPVRQSQTDERPRLSDRRRLKKSRKAIRTAHEKSRHQTLFNDGSINDSGNDLLSHLAALSSALKTLTIEFGMGSGVCNQVWSPENSLRASIDTRRDYSNIAETEQ